jgi:integrase
MAATASADRIKSSSRIDQAGRPIRIALMTGARKSNICKMRWQDVNLKEGVWLIPETKK